MLDMSGTLIVNAGSACTFTCQCIKTILCSYQIALGVDLQPHNLTCYEVQLALVDLHQMAQ